MSFQDFTKQYSQVGVCKTVPSSWNSEIKHGVWKAPHHAGGPSEPLAHFNPTFELTNNDPTVWVQFEQPDQRRTKGDWIMATLRVVRPPKDGQHMDINDTVVCLMLSERQRTVELSLNPAEGPYLIVLTTWAPGIEGEFYVTVHSPGSSSLLPPPS